MFVLGSLLLVAGTGCGGGGGGGGGPAGSGTVTTTLSDPAPCSGEFSHVWVTIAGVKAHINGSAAPGSSGFVDVTPGLVDSPKQVDLLAQPNTECVLATLGTTSGLPLGTYQQIRLILVANDATGVKLSTNGGVNQCDSVGGFNCVVDSSSVAHLLNLPSEARTGIKIPPGQLAGGGLTIGQGKGLDLDIDFNACTSVVRRSNSGEFNLKPTLRAAELGSSPLIAGMVVVANVMESAVVPSKTAVVGASVWLEQQSHDVTVQGGSGGTDKVENLIQTVTTGAGGSFNFCPVAQGTYEIVAEADGSAKACVLVSNVTITTGVSVTGNGGPNNLIIPLVAETTGPATILGQFTTTGSSPPGAGDDITFGGLQAFNNGSLQALVPFLPRTSPQPPVVTTGSSPTGCPSSVLIGGSSCPSGTNCACYSLQVPSSNPVVGAASSSGNGYSPPAAGAVNYAVNAKATVQGSSTEVCSPSELATPSNIDAAAGGMLATLGNLNFTGCD